MLNLLQNFKTKQKEKNKIHNYDLWPPKMRISYFNFILDHIFLKCLQIVRKWINVDVLTKTNQSYI
jgi:hypothetical protein